MTNLLVMILNAVKFDGHRDYKVGKMKDTKFIYRKADEYDIYEFGMSIACTLCYYVLKYIPLCILVFDDDYDEFNDEEKEFIVFHELGHVNLHFKTHNIMNYDDEMSYENKISIEHEADMYGIEHTSYKAGISVMEKIIDMYDDKEVKRRLRLIKNKLN